MRTECLRQCLDLRGRKCGRLDNEELYNMYTSLNIIRVIKLRKMSWAGHVACMEVMRNVYIILVRKPEGKRPLR